MRFGSLFAGIGGFDLGLERAGMESAWQVEIDVYCRQVLAKHWPDAARYEDVRGVGAHNLEPVELICGGFPCQDVSQAGRKAGINGSRSGLWTEFARIIRELRPRYVIVENVPGLLRRGMGTVLGDLSEIGYDAEWQVISAADVGAPHLRKRVWIVGYPNQQQRRAEAAGWQTGRVPQESGAAVPVVADTGGQPRSLRPATGERQRGPASGCSVLAGPTRLLEGRQEQRPPLGERAREGRESGAVPDASIEHAGHGDDGDVQIFGPGTIDRLRQSAIRSREGWLAEPDVGRVAHGIPRRVDRLKGLGNAIVPQIAELIGRRILEVGAL